MAIIGQRANPFSLNVPGAQTYDKFSTTHYRVELRKGYDNGFWVWLRVTTRQGSNMPVTTAILTTIGGSTSGLAYGQLDNWQIGSIGCTEAIYIGDSVRPTPMTYTLGDGGINSTKSVRK